MLLWIIGINTRLSWRIKSLLISFSPLSLNIRRHDNFFMPLEKLAKAPFTVYVIKQKEGDFVLVPPECTHQVVNKVFIEVVVKKTI